MRFKGLKYGDQDDAVSLRPVKLARQFIEILHGTSSVLAPIRLSDRGGFCIVDARCRRHPEFSSLFDDWYRCSGVSRQTFFVDEVPIVCHSGFLPENGMATDDTLYWWVESLPR